MESSSHSFGNTFFCKKAIDRKFTELRGSQQLFVLNRYTIWNLNIANLFIILEAYQIGIQKLITDQLMATLL